MSARVAKRCVIYSLHTLVIVLLSNVFADDTFDKLFESGKYDDVLKYADEKLPIANRDAAAWVKIGIANEDQQFTEKALACYMVAIRNDVKNYEAHLGAARVYNKLNQPESGLDMAKKAIELKATGEASWEFAKACIALNRTAEAKSALEKVVESDKSNLVAAAALGTIYYNAKEYRKALPSLLSAYSSKADGESALKIGISYKTLNVLDSAAIFYKEAIKDPKFAKPDAALELARILYQTEKYAEAAQQFGQINEAILSADDLYKMGLSIEKSSQDTARAIRGYEAALKKFGASNSKEALHSREMVGRWKLKTKNYTEALGIFELVYKADPQGKNVPDIFILLAQSYDGKGERLKAIPLLEKVTAANKDNIQAFAQLADLYAKEKMADKAQAIYEKLVTMQPNNPKVFMALGDYNFKTRKFEDALKYFQKSFTLEQNALAALGMMNSAWELKRFDLALDAAETALHKDSSLTDAKVIVAKINMMNSNWLAAIQVVESLIKHQPGNKAFWQNLGTCYEKTGNKAKLAETDKAIIGIDKKDIISRSRYAQYAMSNGDENSAYLVYKELAGLTPNDPAVYKNLFDLAVKLNQSDEAISFLKKYVALRPLDAGASRDLGNLLYDKKDKSGALIAYKAALKADPAIKGFYKKYADLMMEQKGQEQEIIAVLSSAVKAGEASDEIYMTLGDIYQKQGNFPAAIEMLTKALQLKPQNFDALSSLAYCQQKAGKISDAIISYEQAVAMNPNSVKELKALGDLYVQQGKRDQGIAVYKKYIEKSPADAATAQLIGEAEYGKKNYQEAVKFLGMVSGPDAKKPAFMQIYADAVYQVGDLRKSEEIHKAIAASDPKNPNSFKTLYEISLKGNNPVAAADYLRKYLLLKPLDVVMQQAYGDLLFSLKNAPGALNAYRTVLKLNPGARGFYKAYVQLVNQVGTPDEKIAALSGAISASEAEPEYYAQLGSLYKNSNNCQKAIPQLEKASQIDVKNTGLLVALAECQAKVGVIDAAILTYEQALAMLPNADKEYKALGDLYVQQKKTDPAIKSYKKYLEKSTDNVIAKIVGENALALKNYPDAVKYFSMVTGEDAKSVQFLTVFGKASLEAQNNEKAISIYKQLLILTPQSADVAKALYDLSMRSGAKDDALVYLRKYTSIRPADAGAQKSLGDALFDRNDKAGALNSYRAALKADPAIKGLYNRYAGLLMASGVTTTDAEITTVLSGAIASNEADKNMYVRLGEIYRKQANYVKASQMYEKASQLDPKDAKLLTSLAECHAQAGALGSAILTYEQAIAMNPQANREFKELGDLYTKQKKTDEAIRNYKRYLEKNSDNALARQIGDYAFNAKVYPDAIKYLGMISGAESNSVPVLKMIGESCLQLKDDMKAYQIFKQLAIQTPKDPVVFKKLYEIAGRVASKDEALLYLRQYTSLNPSDADALKKLGDMLYERNDKAGAVNAYKATLKADPAAKGFYVRYAEVVMTTSTNDAEILSVLNGAVANGEADVKMYVKLGDVYFKQVNYVKASQMFEKASQLNPGDANLLTKLAESQAKAGNNSAAVLTYEQAIAMNPQANKEYKALGDLYIQQKRTDIAVKNYKKYLEKNSDNTIARIVGESEYAGKNYPSAVKYLSMITGADANTASTLRMLGDASYQSKDDFKSYQIFKQLATLTPSDPVVFKKLYEIAGRAGTKEEVLLYLKKYASLNASDAPAQITLGDMLYERKDNAGALAAYRAALKADPASKGLYGRYTELVMGSNGTDIELIAALNGAVAAGEADVKMYVRLGEIYRKQTNYVKAAQMFEKASQLSPKDANLLNSLAECQAKAGNASAAILTYEQAIAMNPQANKEYKALGDLYVQQKRNDAAVKNYQKYLEKNSDPVIARFVGETSYSNKDFAAAVKYLGLITGSEASSAAYLRMMGDACLQVKDDLKAYQVFKQLAIATPQDPVVFKKLYEIANRAGTKDDVLLYLKKYTSLNPSDAASNKILGDMLYERKDNTGAIAAYRATLKANPSSRGFYANYAELVMATGSAETELLTVLNGAIAANEADAKMYIRLGDIYRKQNNFVKAGQMFEKASQLNPKDAGLLTDLADCQAKAGNIGSAILTYEQSVAMNPQANKEYKALGDLYMQQKRNDAAVKNYKKYLEKNSDNRIARMIGEYSYSTKNYTDAVKYLGMVTGADANSPVFLKAYADASLQSKDDYKSYQIFKQLSVLTPKDPVVFKNLSEIAARAGTKDEVLLYLQKYVALAPSDAEAQITIGNMLYEKKNAAGAIAAYRAALKANPAAKGFYGKYAELIMASSTATELELTAVLNGAIAANEADVKMYVKLGDLYSNQKNFRKASQMYEKASQLNPKDPSLLTRLAECQTLSGNVSAAVLTYEQVVAMNPSANREYRQLGDLYMKQSKTDLAMKAYKKYVEKTADNAISKQIGVYSYEQKNYTDAAKYLAFVTGTEASSVAHLKLYGNACYLAKDDFRANQIFKQLSLRTPQDHEVFFKLYDIASRTGTKEEVLTYLKKCTILKPNDAKTQKTLGDLLFERNDNVGAISAYRAALKADSTIKGIYKKYATLAMSMGTDDEKIRAFKGAIAAGEADAKMLATLGEIYKKQNLMVKAIEMYNKAAQLDPKNLSYLSELADCYMKSGNISEAILTYEQVVAVNPDANKEYKQLGDLYSKQNKKDLALKSYKRYLEKNPSDQAIAKTVGEQAYASKNYVDAMKYFAMVINADAKNPVFLKMYGDAAYQMQDNPKSLRIYQELALLTPKDAIVFKRLYEISLKAGASEQALSNLRKYAALTPTDAEAQSKLGDLLFDRNDVVGALAAYKLAFKTNPKIKGIYKKYVDLVLRIGTPAEKMAVLSAAIAAGEGDTRMYIQLGDMYKNAGNYQKAIPVYEKGSQLDPRNAEVLSSLAFCQLKSGALAQASITYEQVLAMNPSAVKEYKQLGDLYMQQNKVSSAISAYKKYLDRGASDPEVASTVAMSAYKDKNYQDAYKYFGMVKNNKSNDYHLQYGLSAMQVKDYKVAIKELEILRNTKGVVQSRDVAYKALAQAYEKSGDLKTAADVLNAYVKLPGVRDPEASYLRAVIYEGINPTMAVTMYEENAVTFPKDHRNFLKLGIYYARQPNAQIKAVKNLERCATLTDTISKVWLELGTLYSKQKRDQDMINAYRKFIEVDPSNAEACGKIGEILLSKKMTDDAMVFLEMANSLKEDDPKIMTLLARGYIMTKRRNEGARILEKVVKLTKGEVDDDLRNVLADVYMESGQFDKAVESYKIMLAKKRENTILVKYANALIELGKFNEAANAIEDVKSTEPENLQAHMMLGKIKVAQKKYDEAIETYKEVLYIDQNYAPALCERANVYMIQNKLQWAKTFYERSLKADSKNAIAHLGLARIAKIEKDYASYTDHLEKARKLDPQNKEILDELKSVKR
jgi:tetratricopeptide (TPR) repeat protein